MSCSAPLLVISVEFHHQDLNSDKQFIRDLLHCVARRRRVVVLSISGCEPYDVDYRESGTNIRIINVNRLFHSRSSGFGSPLIPHRGHSSVRNLVELFVTVLGNFRLIRQIVQSERIGIIHVTDQVGPIATVLRRLKRGITLTIAKPTARLFSRSLGGIAYRQLVRLNYRHWDFVVPYTHECARQLRQWGVRTPFCVIHWGVKEPCVAEPNKNVSLEPYFLVTDRGITSVDPRQLVSLVTELAVSMAMRAVISVRKSRYRHKMAELSNEHVTVECSDEHYYAKLGAAQLLFCPNNERYETSLIPLVWLEAMQRGVPVVTPNRPGASEAIKSFENGLLYDDATSLIESDIHAFLAKRWQLSENCVSTVVPSFRVPFLAEKYHECWTQE